MQIEVNGKAYTIPDEWPIDAPRLTTLRRHLGTHGLESLLTYQRYGEYARCILDRVLDSSGRVVGSHGDPEGSIE